MEEKMRDEILCLMEEAESKAWKSLSGYKFFMFGYHASQWVNYREILGEKIPNPFYAIVKIAQEKKVEGGD